MCDTSCKSACKSTCNRACNSDSCRTNNCYTSQTATANSILNSYAKCAQKGYGGGINQKGIHIDKKIQATTLQISNKIVKGKDGNVKNIQAPLINSINYKTPVKEQCGPLCGGNCYPNTRKLKNKKLKEKARVNTDAFWRTGGQLDCRKKQPRKIVCGNDATQLKQKWKDSKCGTFKNIGRAIAYGNDRFIAGGRNLPDSDTSSPDLKTIKYSDDGGITWNDTLSGNFTANCNGIAYADGLWVACGENLNTASPTIKYSTDNGLTWENGTNDFTDRGYGVAYGGGRWVAVGASAIIKYSDDGINWIDTSTSSVFNQRGNSVLYLGNQRWIAVGGDGTTIAISEDNAENWTILNSSSNSFNEDGFGIARDDCGKLVAVGLDNTQKTIIYSEDRGDTWINAESGQFTLIGFNVAYANGVWVAVGADDPSQPKSHTIKYSFNGKNWHNTGCNEFTEKNDDFSGGIAIAYGCENWVAVGSNNPRDSKTIKYVEPIEEPVNYGGGAVYNYTVTRGNKISTTRNVDYTSSFKTASLNGKNCLGVIASKKQKNLKECSTQPKKKCVYGCEPIKLTQPKKFNLSISRNKNLNFLGSLKTF